MAKVSIAPMKLADVSQVVEIDHLSFPLPWSANSYRHELLENDHAHFFVAVDGVRRGWRAWLGLSAERRVIGARDEGKLKINASSIAYLNRLSSFLYVFARLANHESGIKEEAPTY